MISLEIIVTKPQNNFTGVKGKQCLDNYFQKFLFLWFAAIT